MGNPKGTVTHRRGEGGCWGELLPYKEGVYPLYKSFEEGGDEVCFSCKDGGYLIGCDYRKCPKVYHPECMDKNDKLQSSEKIKCRWHTCFICKKSSNFQCICRPDYSVCDRCMIRAQFVQVKSSIWPTNGFCINCLSTVIMIEKSVEVDSYGVKDLKVDFDDSSTYEFYFKHYWKAVNKIERFPLDQLEKNIDYLESFNKEEQRKSKRKKIKEEGSEDDKKKRRSRNENTQCPTCKDTKGLCEGGSRMENEFTLTLPVDFESSTPIPCYIRERFLQYWFGINDTPRRFKAHLATKHNCIFKVKVKNCSDVTIIYSWRKFIRLNQMKVGMELVFEFSETTDKCLMVSMQSLPILPYSYYYNLNKLGRQLVDEMDNICNAKGNLSD